MASTTSVLGIPYPDGADPADVPTDLQALAEKLEELLIEGDVSAGLTTGDLKYSARSADHGRWLKCDGRELTQAEVESALSLSAGDAAALVTLLGTGSSSAYGDATGGKVKLPDLRRSIPMSAGPTGDGSGSLSARPLKGTGSSGGVETVTLSAAQSGIRTHDHGDGSLAAASHSHSDGSLGVASHSHSDGSLAAAGHTHGPGDYKTNIGNVWGNVLVDYATVWYGVPWDVVGTPFGQVDRHQMKIVGSSSSASADVSGATGTAAPDVSGSTGSAGADVTGSTGTQTNVTSAGSDATSSHDNMPPYRTIGYGFIRV